MSIADEKRPEMVTMARPEKRKIYSVFLPFYFKHDIDYDDALEGTEEAELLFEDGDGNNLVNGVLAFLGLCLHGSQQGVGTLYMGLDGPVVVATDMEQTRGEPLTYGDLLAVDGEVISTGALVRLFSSIPLSDELKSLPLLPEPIDLGPIERFIEATTRFHDSMIRVKQTLARLKMEKSEVGRQKQHISQLTEALLMISEWKSHPADLSVDYGSNGVRDYYRGIADAAIKKANYPRFATAALLENLESRHKRAVNCRATAEAMKQPEEILAAHRGAETEAWNSLQAANQIFNEIFYGKS